LAQAMWLLLLLIKLFVSIPHDNPLKKFAHGFIDTRELPDLPPQQESYLDN